MPWSRMQAGVVVGPAHLIWRSCEVDTRDHEAVKAMVASLHNRACFAYDCSNPDLGIELASLAMPIAGAIVKFPPMR